MSYTADEIERATEAGYNAMQASAGLKFANINAWLQDRYKTLVRTALPVAQALRAKRVKANKVKQASSSNKRGRK